MGVLDRARGAQDPHIGVPLELVKPPGQVGSVVEKDGPGKVGTPVKGEVSGFGGSARIPKVGQKITILASILVLGGSARIGLEYEEPAFGAEKSLDIIGYADGHPLEIGGDLVVGDQHRRAEGFAGMVLIVVHEDLVFQGGRIAALPYPEG